MILLESDHELNVLASANSRTVAVSQSYTETDIIWVVYMSIPPIISCEHLSCIFL